MALQSAQRRILIKRKVRPIQQIALTNFAKAVFALVVFACSCSSVFGEEVETDVAGLNVTGWIQFRTPDKPSWPVTFTFNGSKISENPDASISNVIVLRAADDTGSDLLWTNPSSAEIDPPASGYYKSGVFERELRASAILKSPSTEAKSLKLEGKVDLLTPTIPRVVITNVFAHSGEVLRDPLLDKDKIEIKVLDRQNGLPQTIHIECKDPNHKVLESSFQHRDGAPIYDVSSSQTHMGTNRILSFTFKEESLQDIDLAVRLDVPQRRETAHFRIDRLPLPWIQPTNLVVVETSVLPLDASPVRRGCLLLATLEGGLLTNAAAIRKITITKIVSDPQQQVDATLNDLAPYSVTTRSDLEDGGVLTKPIGIYIRSPGAIRIKLLEGDAELLYSTSKVDTVEINADLKPGELITNAKLQENGVVFKFVGARNFKTTAQELAKSDQVTFGYGSERDKNAPANTNDALLFTYQDPREAMLSHVSVPIEFFDEREKPVPCASLLITPKSYLIRLVATPKKTRLNMKLINPAAVHHENFKLKDVQVPAITKHYLESEEALELQADDAFWWLYSRDGK